ncbi:trypsin-like serine peptidase [Streptosporangium sp. G11]|uniref:trypsin-like serine peptidase n=1 Tax=Streptosporangium sp. G11 TaxID=3436926 RepID=UPI003EBC4112
MRRTLIALGVGLGLLGSTVVSVPAQAAGSVKVLLASTVPVAQQVAAFWLADDAANLRNATPYAVRTVLQGERLSTPVVPDGPPFQIPPIPLEEERPSSTSGKVFFVGADGQPHWCTGTSMQSKYRNIVATAGHCVRDTQREGATLDKWAFVPGYSEGTTPWGLYVGKLAFVHHDFDVYAGHDRDFAFVNVYGGVVSSSTGVLTNTGKLAENVGGQGIAFNQATTPSADVLGYPAGPHPDGTRPYTGQTLESSTGPTFAVTLPDAPTGRLIGVESPFTGEGAIGSSWLYDYSGDSRTGHLNGITIGVSDTDGDNRYDTGVSPYFDNEVRAVYMSALSMWTGSIAQPAAAVASRPGGTGLSSHP